MQNCVGYGVIVLYIFRKPAASIFLFILFLTAKMQICDFRMFCNFCFSLCTFGTMRILKFKHYDNNIVFISHMNRYRVKAQCDYIQGMPLPWPCSQYCFCLFMDLDFVSVHKHAKKELGQYPAILTSRLVNNPYILLKDISLFGCDSGQGFQI